MTFGIPAALALDRANFPGKGLVPATGAVATDLPGIITGLSLLMLFREADMKLSLLTIILGHGTALISVATTEVFAGLQKTRSRAGRSFARPGRKLLANLLARNPPQSAAVDHRRSLADLHALDGRDRSQLFPDRTRQHSATRNLGTPAARHHSRNQRHLDASSSSSRWSQSWPGTGSRRKAKRTWCCSAGVPPAVPERASRLAQLEPDPRCPRN